MLYYSNFIFLYLHLLFVQSDDRDIIPFDYYELERSSSTLVSPIRYDKSVFRPISEAGRRFKSYNPATVSECRCVLVSKGRHHCYGDGCTSGSGYEAALAVVKAVLIITALAWLIGLLRYARCCSFCTNRNNITIRFNHRASSSNALSKHLETTQQHIESFNLQTLSGNISLRNVTDSTEGPLPAYCSLSLSRAITTSVEEPSSNESPASDDAIQHSTITITMEQESPSPPIDNDFIRGT